MNAIIRINAFDTQPQDILASFASFLLYLLYLFGQLWCDKIKTCTQGEISS